MPKQTTGVSFDVKTLKALRVRAKSERRSISMLVNWAVEVWLEAQNQASPDSLPMAGPKSRKRAPK